jgi:hypothetical protein
VASASFAAVSAARLVRNRIVAPVGSVTVPAPAGVDLGRVDVEVPPEQVRSRAGGRVEDRGAAAASAVLADDPVCADEPCDAFAGVSAPLAGQVGVDPRGPVTALGHAVVVADPLQQLAVLTFATGAAGGPGGGVGVVGGPGDLQQHARTGHAPRPTVRAALLLRLDEGGDLHRVSFAKKAVARLRMSPKHVGRGAEKNR